MRDSDKQPTLLILSGGLSTRLGPLTATSSKSLVTIGQQPMIIRQIIGTGARRVVVVASRGTADSIRALLARCLTVDWVVVEQDDARGPCDAMRCGFHACGPDDDVRVLFADTLLDDWSLRYNATYAAVSHPLATDRSWTWYNVASHAWVDGVPPSADVNVFIGDLFVTAQERDDVLVYLLSNPTVANLLNRLRPSRQFVTGWYDTGDLAALTATRRAHFMARPHHNISLTERGTLVKRNLPPQEGEFYRRLPREARHLFPRVYGNSPVGLELEYIDLPSLAELWLYWPGRPDMWQHIFRTVIDQVKVLWATDHGEARASRFGEMMLDKTVKRWPDTPRPLLDALWRLQISAHEHVAIHGDLNFCNILMGLGTGQVRFVDPRGEWGDGTGLGDVRYEYAKLRYSWNGFVAATHDLDPVHIRSRHAEEIRALDDVLARMADVDLRNLALFESALFYSAIPLHPDRQRDALLQLAEERMKEGLS